MSALELICSIASCCIMGFVIYDASDLSDYPLRKPLPLPSPEPTPLPPPIPLSWFVPSKNTVALTFGLGAATLVVSLPTMLLINEIIISELIPSNFFVEMNEMSQKMAVVLSTETKIWIINQELFELTEKLNSNLSDEDKNSLLRRISYKSETLDDLNNRLERANVGNRFKSIHDRIRITKNFFRW